MKVNNQKKRITTLLDLNEHTHTKQRKRERDPTVVHSRHTVARDQAVDREGQGSVLLLVLLLLLPLQQPVTTKCDVASKQLCLYQHQAIPAG